MDRYTVLLVDDEEEVIQVIIKKINWEWLGFSVIGYATNGIKAIEMVEEFRPDVIMTDIKMPYMDGMELCKRVKMEYPATKILLFTGFDEFEYAKEAIHLEVEEYVLKPINSVELTNIFIHMKAKLDQEISEKRNVEILQKYYLESLPLLQANFYSTLIEGRVNEDEISRYLSDFQIDFSGAFFCCVVIYTSSGKIPKGMNPLLLSTSVQKQAEEYLGKNWQVKCFSYLGKTILIVQLREECEVSRLTDECDRFCRYADRMIGATVTIGIGRVCDNILGLPLSYSSASEAVSYRVIYGSSKAINIKEIAPQEMNKVSLLNPVGQSNLFKAIRLGTTEEITEAVRAYQKQLTLSAKSLQQYHIAVMELMSELYKFATDHEITIEDFMGDMRKLYSTLLDLEGEGIKKCLLDISLSFREKLIHARSSTTESFISMAKEYVRNNYADEELSLDSICKVLNVSNSYFSTIFKKETGNSFIGYLTDYRMEHAARQLLETDAKNYIIAQNVGYSDPNYFSYVFKRQFGMSPSKYRAEHTKSER